MSKVCQRYAESVSQHFTASDLRAASQRLANRGITCGELASELGVSLSVVRNVLSGRRVCRRGGSHKVAVALGLKKAPPAGDKVTDIGHFVPPAAPAAGSPEAVGRVVSLALGPEPTKMESQQIEVLRRYAGRPVKAVDAIDLMSGVPPAGTGEFDAGALIRSHGFKVSTMRRTLRRHLGKPTPPAGHTVAWQVLAAASCQKGIELCGGMARQIADLRKRFPDQLAKKKPAKKSGRRKK